jgi:hypothetical protein
MSDRQVRRVKLFRILTAVISGIMIIAMILAMIRF